MRGGVEGGNTRDEGEESVCCLWSISSSLSALCATALGTLSWRPLLDHDLCLCHCRGLLFPIRGSEDSDYLDYFSGQVSANSPHSTTAVLYSNPDAGNKGRQADLSNQIIGKVLFGTVSEKTTKEPMPP